MRVKLKTLMCGPAGNFNIGQVADFDDFEAQALIDGGYADAVDFPPVAAPATVAEVAAIAAPEVATAINQKQGKRGRNAA
jgi:hypothetical protein